MDLQQLEAFCVAVRRGSISAGARDLQITQSAVSQRIKALELSLGTRLLERTPGGVAPTPAGERVLRVGLRVLRLCDRLEAELREEPQPERLTLRVGATPALGGHVLPHALSGLAQVVPGLEADLQVGRLPSLLQRLEDGELHLLFTEGPLDRAGIRTIPVGRDQLRLVAPATGPWEDRVVIEPEEWLELPHILFRPGCGMRRALIQAMVAAGLPTDKLQIVAEIDNLEAVKSLVEAGGGVTWLPRRAVRRGLQAGTLQTLDVRGFRVDYTYVAAYHSNRPLSQAARQCVGLVADILSPRASRRRRVPVGQGLEVR